MTILKISNYYLSLPHKNQAAKSFFEAYLETYVTKKMDQDTEFDLDLFVENLDYDNDSLEQLDGDIIKDEEVYFEYTEEGLEEMIQKLFDDNENEENDEEVYYSDRGNED